MKLKTITALVVVQMFGLSCAWAQDSELVLAEASISAAGHQKHHYTQAGASSGVSKEDIDRSITGLDSVIRALPGTFTSMDTPQGTLSVNIRGMTGFGRVNTMIDGVPQTLFGVTATSEGEAGFHDSAPSTSAFGATIDPNFLVGADVNRGGQGGSHGVNALMGSANFRTIGIDDVISTQKPWGVQVKYSHGSNKLGPNGMLAAAFRQRLSDQISLGTLFAVSGANKSTDYKRGDGKLASSNDYVMVKTQKPRSYLAKAELGLDDDKLLEASVRHYKTNIGGRELVNSSYGLDYRYTPDSDLLDLSIKANFTKNKQTLNKDAKYGQLEQAQADNKAKFFDVNNSSYFYWPGWELATNYGLSYQTNDYQRQAKATDQDAFDRTTFSPSGQQKILSLYTNNTLKRGIYTADLSLSRVHTQFSGHKPACDRVGDVAVPCFPVGEANIQNKQANWNSKVQLSARVNDWFSPFISYARTSRMPNIQEVFFNNEGGGSMNPFLEPEKADIKELGFNIFKHKVFGEHDSLGLKAVYFHSKIKNYIHTQSFFLTDQGGLTSDINQVGPAGFNAHLSVNSLVPVVSRGVEIQANYDTGKYFGSLSYTKAKSNQPVNINSGFHDFGFSGGATDRLPERYWTLGLGSRLLDDKLKLGMDLKYYGKNVRLRPDGPDFETSNYHLDSMPKSPIVTDLYASYQIHPQATIRLGVENVFDKLYIHPLNSQNSNYSQLGEDGESYNYTNYARGRTISLGAQLQF